ncbi:MAG: hypothetical protein AB7E52_07130 [Bdellovibrionales bacterium]
MKIEGNGSGLVRGVPLAVVVTLCLQLAGAIWWVSAKARDTEYLDQKVVSLEGAFDRATNVQSKMLDRLARIEERSAAQSVLLERIDKQVARLQ